MKRAASVFLALAILSPLFPASLVAEEMQTPAPGIEESPAIQEEPESLSVETTASEAQLEERTTTLPAPGEETLIPEEPPRLAEESVFFEKTTQTAPLAASAGTVIFSNISVAEPIIVIGFSGGAYLYLYQQLVAQSSGVITEMDVYLSQYSGGNSKSIRIDVYDETGTEFLCSILDIGENSSPGPRLDAWNSIPFAEAAPELVTLPELGTSSSGCELVEGETYTVRLGISSSSVNGTVRLYTRGDLPENFYFVARSTPPPPPVCTENCYSNVLFLPGILGSRLSEGGEQRWEPENEDDILALYFGPGGTSQSEDIEATEVIETFQSSSVPDTHIYSAFISDLAQLQAGGVINEYQAVPYDWRKYIPDIIADGDIENTLRVLAENSRTDKVTIVAHSNGGLVTKALLNELGSEASELVDKVVFVGVPQLGTPQAIGGLLHGYETGLPFDWLPLLLSPERARDLSRNMPMTYQLLPHADYYDNVGVSISTPLVSFEDGVATSLLYEAYGGAITNNEKMQDFLLGAEGREVPDYDDLENPAVIRAARLADAEALMESIGSSWTPPPGIEIHQIAGVGEETLAGIHYKTVKECVIPVLINGALACLKFETKLSYVPNEVLDGDGTVVTPSALLMSESTDDVERWWLNLKQNNADNGRVSVFKLNHGTLFEVDELRAFVLSNVLIKDFSAIPNYISGIAPVFSQENFLRFTLHSPLDLSVEDENGKKISKNHAEIPGASFKRYGEVQVVHVPADAAPTVKLSGVSDGSFTLDIEEYEGETLTASASFSGVPSLKETQAEMEFLDGTIEGASDLIVDYEGDGIVDLALTPAEGEVVAPGGDSLTDVLQVLKQAIAELSSSQKVKDKLLKKVQGIETKIEKKKLKNQRIISKLSEKITKGTQKGKISAGDAASLTSLIETLELGAGEVSFDADVLAALKISIQNIIAPEPLKQELLKRVTKLENTQNLIKTLDTFSYLIIKKGEKGKITEAEVQSLLDLLILVETNL